MKKRVSVILLLMLTLALCLSAAVMAGVQLMAVDDEDECTHYTDEEAIEYRRNDDDTTHDTHDVFCKICNKVVIPADPCEFDFEYEKVNETQHVGKCICGRVSAVYESHVPGYIPTEGNRKHVEGCTKCHDVTGEEKEHSYDEHGACESCGFHPVLSDSEGNLYDDVYYSDAFVRAAAGEVSYVQLECGADEKVARLEIEFNYPGEPVELRMNNIALTGAGHPAITVLDGSLTISGEAAISAPNDRTGQSSCAISVRGGTLTFAGKANITGGVGNGGVQPAISVSGGTVTFRGDLTAKGGYYYAGGNNDAQAPAVKAEGGTLDFQGDETTLSFVGGLTITGTAKLENGLTHGTFWSNAGYAVIDTPSQVQRVSVVGSRVYNKNVNNLLADNYVFKNLDPDSKNQYFTSSFESLGWNVTIAFHTHTTWEEKDGKYVCSECGEICYHEDGYVDGKCKVCGAPCTHEADMADAEGHWKCDNCGAQLYARIKTGNIWVHYTSLKDAMNAAQNGDTIILEDDLDQSSWYNNAKTACLAGDGKIVTLDLNGHTIREGWIFVGRDQNNTAFYSATLKIIGNGSFITSGNITISTKGTLDLSEWTNCSISTVSVSCNGNTGDAGSLIIGENDVHIGKLNYTSWSLSAIKNAELCGGTYEGITITLASGIDNVAFSGLLVPGYAFQYTDGSGYVDYGTKAVYDNSGLHNIYNVRVVKCTAHVDIDNNGLCDYCNTKVSTAAAKVETGNGTFYCDLPAAVEKVNAVGGTITMQKNVTGLGETLTLYGGNPITLDLNGKTISGNDTVFFVGSTVTICDGTDNAAGGKVINTSEANHYAIGVGMWDIYFDPNLTIKGGTFEGPLALRVDDGSASVTIEGGTFKNQVSFLAFKTAEISGGTFASINTSKGTVRDLLAEGKAFADAEGNILNATVTNLTNVHVVDCKHPNVDDSSKCTACGMQMTAKVEKDGTTTYYADGYFSNNLKSGLYFAIKNAESGSTVTALANSDPDRPYYPGGYVKDGKSLTLNLNGKEIGAIYVGDYTNGNTLTITGGGKIDELRVDQGNTAVLTAYGCEYGIGTTFGKIFADGATPGSLLAEGYAFRVGDDEYVAYNAETIPENVTVVQCSHIDIDVVEDATGTRSGTCRYCGESGIAARLTMGETEYTYNTIDKAVEAWLLNTGSTLTLYTDYGTTGNFPPDRALTLDLNGCRFNVDKDGDFTGSMNLDGATLTIRDSSGNNGIFGSLTAGSGHLTLLSGRIKGLTVEAEKVVSLQGGTVEAVDCPYPIYKLIPNGWALINGGLTVDPATKFEPSATYTIINSQNLNITAESGKTGSVDYGEKAIPFALTLTTADSDVKWMQFKWYLVQDNTTTLLATSTEDIVAAENGVYAVNADTSWTINAEGWEGLDASTTPYDVICVVIGKTSDKAFWQTAYGGYKLTVEPASLSGAVITQAPNSGNTGTPEDNRLVVQIYTSSTLDGVKYEFNVTCGGKTLTEGVDYEIVDNSNWATNAGTHELTISGIGNYAGTKTVQWTLEPYELSKDNFHTAQIGKLYDGTDKVSGSTNGLPSLNGFNIDNKNPRNSRATVSDFRLDSDAYTLSNMKFGSKDFGGTTFSFTFTLKEGGNFVFSDGTMSLDRTQDAMITQATLTDPEAVTISVTNKLAKTYEIDLSQYLPTLASPMEYGTVAYELSNTTFTVSDYYSDTEGASVDDSGVLSLPIQAVDTGVEQKIGTVQVTVKTRNYHEFTLTLNISTTNKLVPTAQEVSATEITYGDTLSKSTITGKMIDTKNNDQEVTGTFSWVKGSDKPDAGNYKAMWKFTPTDGSTYAETTGTVVVKVNRKSIDDTLSVNFSELTYNGNPQTPTVNSVTFQLDPDDFEDVALIADKDYSVTVEPQTNAGQYKLTINGEGNYAGSVEKTWLIGQKVVLNPTITVADGVYNNGEGVTPEVTVKDGETVIPESEYEVIYSNNKNAGTGKVEVKSKDGSNYQLGDAGALFEQTFTINKADQNISVDTINAIYGDTGVKAFNGTLYGETTYTVTAGDDVVRVDGEGNLTFLKAGSAKIKIAAAGDNNHNSAEKEITVEVAKKSLTVRALDRTAYVGGTAPDLTKPVRGTDYELVGLVNGDDFEINPTMYYVSKDDPTKKVEPDMTKPGTYVIAFAGFSTTSVYMDNYDGRCANGTLTIDYAPPTTYSITVAESENGSVSASRRSASSGQTVTLTVTPDEGYALSSLTVTDAKGNAAQLTETDGVYSFQMPASKVTVTAAFAEISTEPRFDDVTPDDWFYDDVEWAGKQGLVSGVSDTRFDPNGGCSRAHVVTMLWRAAGCPVVNYLMPFTDVAEDVWYAEAVRWAASERIVLGTSDTTFTPDRVCTRAQIAAMLWRYAQWAEMDTTQGGMAIREFEDYADIPEYALEPMGWAVNAGILVGSDNRLDPNADCTRAQIAAILHRALGK